MSSRNSWGRNLLVAFLSLFFLMFGINTLISAYGTKNPLEFIMYFFSSSLIILISLVGIIYLFFRIPTLTRSSKPDEDDV